jgi:DNA-binding NarL/FixJ family response regulator
VYDRIERHRYWCMRAGAENGRLGVRILLASSRAVTRRALKGLLQTRPELVVVAEAADAQETLSQAEATIPDVVLVDWDARDGRLEDVVGALQRLACQPRVVVLGFSSDSEQAARAAGADAFASKGDPPKSLLTALYAVQVGYTNE